MQFSKKMFLRVVSLVLVFFVFYGACEFFLLTYEGNAYVTMKDLALEEDLDVVVIGNSEACRHFNPYLFQELTGKNSFNLSRTASLLATQYFLMEEMFLQHQPEKVLLFVDPSTLKHTVESSFVQATIWPFLTSPMRKLQYALTLAATDNTYIDRLFPWRLSMPETLGDLKGNLKDKLSNLTGNNRYYDYAYSLLNKGQYAYPGKGYIPIRAEYKTTIEEINKSCKYTYEKEEYIIHTDNQEWFRKMDELCRKNNCQLIAVNVPRLPGFAISNVLNSYDAQRSFFAELGVPYWNFCYAKESLMQQLDASYYYDYNHLTEPGADIMTEALAQVFNTYQNGEDISDLFYTTEEYLESIDFITNTWLVDYEIDGQTRLTAFANHGTNVVPEYCFVKVDANGAETVLQDYSTENRYWVQPDDVKNIRLYARSAANPEQEPVSFSFE